MTCLPPWWCFPASMSTFSASPLTFLLKVHCLIEVYIQFNNIDCTLSQVWLNSHFVIIFVRKWLLMSKFLSFRNTSLLISSNTCLNFLSLSWPLGEKWHLTCIVTFFWFTTDFERLHRFLVILFYIKFSASFIHFATGFCESSFKEY